MWKTLFGFSYQGVTDPATILCNFADALPRNYQLSPPQNLNFESGHKRLKPSPKTIPDILFLYNHQTTVDPTNILSYLSDALPYDYLWSAPPNDIEFGWLNFSDFAETLRFGCRWSAVIWNLGNHTT